MHPYNLRDFNVKLQFWNAGEAGGHHVAHLGWS